MEVFLKNTTCLLAGIFKDETGVVVPVADISTLTITLTDLETGTVINSRNGQNALNANHVAVDSDGNLAWTVQPLDNIIVTAAKTIETHRVIFTWTYPADGSKNGRHIEDFNVQNV